VGTDAEGGRDGVSDRAGGYGSAIDDMEWARDRFWGEVELVLGSESVIDEE
jgi:hypothetical protein